MILHEAARVRSRPVVTVQTSPEHPEHGHLLAAVMRGVSQAAGHDPRARFHRVEKFLRPLPTTSLLWFSILLAVFRCPRHSAGESRCGFPALAGAGYSHRSQASSETTSLH